MARQVKTVYGTALFDAARDTGRLSSVREDAETVLRVLDENPDFLRVLCHPEIQQEEKEKIVDTVFGEKADPLLCGLVETLLMKEHVNELPKVLSCFVEMALEEEKIGVAHVLSALPLADKDKAAIEKKLLDTTRYESMRISYEVEPELIGGLVIRLGDKVVDSSLKTKLYHMKNTLMTGV